MEGLSSPRFPPLLAQVDPTWAGRWEPESGLQKLWLRLKSLLKLVLTLGFQNTGGIFNNVGRKTFQKSCNSTMDGVKGKNHKKMPNVVRVL